MSIAGMREEYETKGLNESDLAADPFTQFHIWFDQAVTAGLPQPNAMALATAAADGRPSARMVLLKGLDENSFVFFTNYESRKAGELAANPWAALVFFWVEFHRQVRVEGHVALTTARESDDYFASRRGGVASERGYPRPRGAGGEGAAAGGRVRRARCSTPALLGRLSPDAHRD